MHQLLGASLFFIGLARFTVQAVVHGGWRLTQNGTTGVSALQLAVTSDTTIIILDKFEHNPLLTADGEPAMASEFNLITREVRPLNALSNVWCAAGGFLGNGTFVNTGGNPVVGTEANGLQAVRLFDPCEDANCDLIEDGGVRQRLTTPRWYPGSVRLEDGSLLLMGGSVLNNYINVIDINNPTYEFYPPKNINGFNGLQIPFGFLNETVNANLYPFQVVLPDGRVFIAANTQATIFDWKTNTETRLPDIPNGVRFSYPMTGGAILLPLTQANNYTPEVLICGGSNVSDTLTASLISSQAPASTQCSRMVLTDEGIEAGWAVEHMPVPRIMTDLIHLPDGRIMIVNGAQTGIAAYGNVPDTVGSSNADHPAFTPVIYDPNAGEGNRFSMEGLPSSNIARMYHSTATLTPDGSVFIAGSNPHTDVCFDIYPTEFRVEFFDPPYMFEDRPVYTGLPATVDYNTTFDLNVTLPSGYDTVTVYLMDLGYHTHSVNMDTRMIELISSLSDDGTKLTVSAPSSPRLYPPGPGHVYVVTGEGVPSFGHRTIIGTGEAPPTDVDAIQNMLDNTNPADPTFVQLPSGTPTSCQAISTATSGTVSATLSSSPTSASLPTSADVTTSTSAESAATSV